MRRFILSALSTFVLVSPAFAEQLWPYREELPLVEATAAPGPGWHPVKCGTAISGANAGNRVCAYQENGDATSPLSPEAQLSNEHARLAMGLAARGEVIEQDLAARGAMQRQDIGVREATLSQNVDYADKMSRIANRSAWQATGRGIVAEVVSAAACSAIRSCRDSGYYGGSGYYPNGRYGEYGQSPLPESVFSLGRTGDQPSRGGQYTRPQ